jgi:hypothetical protein
LLHTFCKSGHLGFLSFRRSIGPKKLFPCFLPSILFFTFPPCLASFFFLVFFRHIFLFVRFLFSPPFLLSPFHNFSTNRGGATFQNIEAFLYYEPYLVLYLLLPFSSISFLLFPSSWPTNLFSLFSGDAVPELRLSLP